MHSPVGHSHPQQGRRVHDPLGHGGQTILVAPDMGEDTAFHAHIRAHPQLCRLLASIGRNHTRLARPGPGKAWRLEPVQPRFGMRIYAIGSKAGLALAYANLLPGDAAEQAARRLTQAVMDTLTPHEDRWRVRLELPEACAEAGQAHAMPGRRVPKLLPDTQVWPHDKHPLLPTSTALGARALQNLLTDPKPLAWDPMGIVYTDGSVIKLRSGDADEDAGEGPPPPGIGAGVYVPAALSRRRPAAAVGMAVEVAILPNAPGQPESTQSTEPSCAPSMLPSAWDTT